MNRAFMYLAALVGLGGLAFLVGSSQAQPPAGAPAAVPPGRPTVAVFNMAKVMKDYTKWRYEGWKLSQKRLGMSGDLGKLKADYIKAQEDIRQARDPKDKEALSRTMLEIQRKVEDREREIRKVIGEEASATISHLYDEIKTVVDKTAETNGCHLIFAYMDAPTPEEAKDPRTKEIKLQMQGGAIPFYVAPHADYTTVIVATLNQWYPSPDIPKGQINPPGPTPGPAPTPSPTPGTSR